MPGSLIRDKDDEGVGYQRYHNKTQVLDLVRQIVSGWNKGFKLQVESIIKLIKR
jgi:hypothetical protein